jgi:hypothetical protein
MEVSSPQKTQPSNQFIGTVNAQSASPMASGLNGLGMQVPGLLDPMSTTIKPVATPSMAMTGDYGAIPEAMEGTDFGPYWSGDPWSDNLAWPWVHEALFLQEDPGPGAIFPQLSRNGDSTSMSNATWESEPYPEARIGQPWATGTLPLPPVPNMMDNMNVVAPNPTINDPMAVDGDLPSRTFSASAVSSFLPRTTPDQKPDLQASQLQAVALTNTTGTSTPTIEPHQNQRNVVEELVRFAFDFSRPKPDPATCSSFWHKMSAKVEQAFDLYHVCPTRSGGHHLLHHFIDLFFERFHPLWPLVRRQNFIYDRTRPHYFLTLASIGSMYAGPAAALYGFLSHESIRLQLLVAPFQYQLQEELLEPLCQSMLLIQVCALYFSHKQAFSIAQQLGSIIVSQARKINLFNDGLSAQVDKQNGKTLKTDEIVSNWIRAEGRRRLAFGILRAEIFVSILLNTRPLVSFEELNLEMPVSNTVWSYDTPELQQYILSRHGTREERQGYLYSDLVRIALDRGEALPNMSPLHFELLLFGLQQIVWRFSHDLALMPRLTGRRDVESIVERQSDLFGSWSFSALHVDQPEDTFGWTTPVANGRRDSGDLLDCSLRDMHDLRTDFARAFIVLRKWKQSFAATAMSAEVTEARNSLLASRLLYHLSFIRLRADIHMFHLLAHKLVRGEPHQPSITSVYRWARSRDAKIALEHACAIWSLISRETERREATRARFNIASHVSLYHAASVVWAFAGTHETPGDASLDMGETRGALTARTEYRIHRGNNAGLMSNFAALLKKITPAWISTSSFSTTTSVMAKCPFPLLKAT